MASWHRIGDATTLRARAPFFLNVERHRIAVFLHDGRLTAISDICNHKGGPLSEARVNGEFVTCPWHGWEYSIVTGKGPKGYDEEQVPVYALLDQAMARAGELHADTQLINLRSLRFRTCEGNYSKASHACTWPCAITERDPDDQLTAVYEGLVHWADVVLISTPIRWGSPSSARFITDLPGELTRVVP